MIDRALKPALDVVEKHWREQWRAAQKAQGKEGAKGALIIVGKQSQDKFFSNGALNHESQLKALAELNITQGSTFQAFSAILIFSVVCRVDLYLASSIDDNS